MRTLLQMGMLDTQRLNKIFINRRNQNRRIVPDPCHKMPIDIYHRKRRKQPDRRTAARTLQDDFYAFSGKILDP